MKVNNKGEPVQFLVTDSGIEEITESHPGWEFDEGPLFETFEEAAGFAIQALCARVAELEKKVRI